MQHPVATPIRLHPNHHSIPINTSTTRHPIQPTARPLYQLHQQRIGSIPPPKRMQHLKAGAILSYPIHHPFAVQPSFLRHSVEPSVFGGKDTGIGEGSVLVGEVGLERSEGVEDMKSGAVGGEGEEKAGVIRSTTACTANQCAIRCKL